MVSSEEFLALQGRVVATDLLVRVLFAELLKQPGNGSVQANHQSMHATLDRLILPNHNEQQRAELLEAVRVALDDFFASVEIKVRDA